MKDPDGPCKDCQHPNRKHTEWRRVRICIERACRCSSEQGFYIDRKAAHR